MSRWSRSSRGGEAQGGGLDACLLLGQHLRVSAMPCRSGRADLEHLRQDLLGADLPQVDHGDQDPVGVGEQGPADSVAWRPGPPRWWK